MKGESLMGARVWLDKIEHFKCSAAQKTSYGWPICLKYFDIFSTEELEWSQQKEKMNYLSQMMDTLITLVQSLYIINIKMTGTVQSINMPD